MGTINGVLQRVQTLDLRHDLPELILATSYEIVALTQEQLYSGHLSTGEKISPDYKDKYYAKKKAGMNPLPGEGTPDTFYSGKFFKAMGVSIKNDTFDIESTVEYAPKLVDEYGDNLIRMSDENKSVYIQGALLDAIKKHITVKTGLQFS